MYCGAFVPDYSLLAGAGRGAAAGGGVGCASVNAFGPRDTAYTFHIHLVQFLRRVQQGTETGSADSFRHNEGSRVEAR